MNSTTVAMSILFSCVFSVYAWPQIEVATVFGTVTDPSGAVIAGAQVVIVNQTTGLKRESSTDSTGQYHIAGLPTGNYSVRVQKEDSRHKFAKELRRLRASLT